MGISCLASRRTALATASHFTLSLHIDRLAQWSRFFMIVLFLSLNSEQKLTVNKHRLTRSVTAFLFSANSDSVSSFVDTSRPFTLTFNETIQLPAYKSIEKKMFTCRIWSPWRRRPSRPATLSAIMSLMYTSVQVSASSEPDPEPLPEL